MSIAAMLLKYLPALVLLAAGFVAARFGRIDRSGLGGLLHYVLIPAYLFYSLLGGVRDGKMLWLIGFGAALFSHGTLTATMRRAPEDQAGLALGAWGSVQATAAGAAIGLSGVLRDVITGLMERTGLDWAGGATAGGYVAVYVLEITLLLTVVIAMLPLLRAQRAGAAADALGPVEPAGALGGDGDARDASPA